MLERAKKPKSNLKGHERRILKYLAQNEAITITNADKGGKIVVLQFTQYAELCEMHILDPAYQRIDHFGSGQERVDLGKTPLFNEDFVESDLADHLVRQLSQKLASTLLSLAKSKDISMEERKHLAPAAPYSGTLPNFYGLPKVHKLGKMKIHVIIACCNL